MSKRNFWKDGYAAEDFYRKLINVNPIKYVSNREEARAIADIANEILREELEKQAVVYSTQGFESFWSKHKDPGSTHTARLVAIEETKK